MSSVQARLIYTGSGTVAEGELTFDDGRIRSVVNRRGKVADHSFDVITPAFIDPHAHIGTRIGRDPGGELGPREPGAPVVDTLDALDSVEMGDFSFRESVREGVLYSCVVPNSRSVISGLTAVVRNYAPDTSSAFLGRAGISAALGAGVPRSVSETGPRRSRMASLSALREALVEAKEQMRLHGDDAIRSPRQAILRSLLRGRERLRFETRGSDDLASVLRLSDEFRLKIGIEHGSELTDSSMLHELRKRQVPLVYGPTSIADTPALRQLHESGVDYGLMSDHPSVPQHTLHHQLRWFLRAGLDRSDAIGVVTRSNARVIGFDQTLGSLEAGKWASFVCWNGDPFDLGCFPVAVFAEGRLLAEYAD